MQKTVYVLAISGLLALFALSAVLADTDSSTTVYVSIQSVSQITLAPSVLSFLAQPGHHAGTKLLDIVNTGSNNVTNIYSYLSTLSDEPFRPYGTANATNYSAGDMIVLKNNSYDKYFFAGRIEWNETSKPINMIIGSVNSPVAWGFYRNTSYEYNWLVGNGTGYGAQIYCNNTGSQFAISDLVDNATAATRTPLSPFSMDGGDENFGYFSVTRASAPLYESCVAVSYDCTKIYIYRYDERTGFLTCTNARYIQALNLTAGSAHTLTLDAYVPWGIPNGDLNTTTFTAVAT
jgi:hypothetical protein